MCVIPNRSTERDREGTEMVLFGAGKAEESVWVSYIFVCVFLGMKEVCLRLWGGLISKSFSYVAYQPHSTSVFPYRTSSFTHVHPL